MLGLVFLPEGLNRPRRRRKSGDRRLHPLSPSFPGSHLPSIREGLLSTRTTLPVTLRPHQHTLSKITLLFSKVLGGHREHFHTHGLISTNPGGRRLQMRELKCRGVRMTGPRQRELLLNLRSLSGLGLPLTCLHRAGPLSAVFTW